MKTKIKDEINNIPIPSGLSERSRRGAEMAWQEQISLEEPFINKSKWMRLNKPSFKGMIAVIVIALIVLSCVVFNTEVRAALQKVLQFVPGIGIVMEEGTLQERYVLAKPISVQVDEGMVEITGVIVDEEMTYITMNGSNVRRMNNIKLINAHGIEFYLDSSMASWSSREWSNSYWHRGKLDIGEKAMLVLPGNPDIVIPLNLTKAESFGSYEDLGETAKVNDITITAIADRVDSRGRITLIAQHPKAFRITSYGILDFNDGSHLTLVDNFGETYTIERYMGITGPSRDFSFLLSDEGTSYTLTLPKINTVYDDRAALTLPIPAEGEVDANIITELAGFPIKITKLERAGDNTLRVYTDIEYDEQATKSLHMVDIEGMSHSAKLDEETGVLQYLEFGIKPDSKKVKIVLSKPEVYIRGPWIFNFSTEQHFSN